MCATCRFTRPENEQCRFAECEAARRARPRRMSIPAMRASGLIKLVGEIFSAPRPIGETVVLRSIYCCAAAR